MPFTIIIVNLYMFLPSFSVIIASARIQLNNIMQLSNRYFYLEVRTVRHQEYAMY